MDANDIKVESSDKKDENVPLPELNKIFMLDGIEYRVVYINEGKNRFTCCPAKQVY